jgi:hypothetical protein
VAFVTPQSVDQLKADLRADYESVKAAVLAGNAARKLDDQTLTEWDGVATRVSTFLDAPSSWLSTASQMDQGQALQRDVASWHARLSALGVTIGPAPQTPSPSIVDSVAKGLADLTEGGPLMLGLVLAVLLSWNKGR